MKDKKTNENYKKNKTKSKDKKIKEEFKEEAQKQTENNDNQLISGISQNLQCLKIQVNSHITEFLYYQRYPKKNNIKYDPKLCALVYYFNEQLDDKFFYLYFSLMGQIDEVFFGSFFGHNNKNKSFSKKKDDSPKIIYFAIIKYVEAESLNILLDGKQAQTLINNYLLKTRNYKLDFQYDPLKDEQNDLDGEQENGADNEKKKNPEDDFVLVSGNTAKNNFSFNGVSFKVAKEKNKVDLELEEDEDENSDMPNFKKKKKKKNRGNDFYWNFQLLDKKRSITEELQQLFAKDKEVIERKKKINQ